nr:hypothetical protein Iba_scaffold11857CG0020 [Ipomoea batatas]
MVDFGVLFPGKAEQRQGEGHFRSSSHSLGGDGDLVARLRRLWSPISLVEVPAWKWQPQLLFSFGRDRRQKGAIDAASLPVPRRRKERECADVAGSPFARRGRQLLMEVRSREAVRSCRPVPGPRNFVAGKGGMPPPFTIAATCVRRRRGSVNFLRCCVAEGVTERRKPSWLLVAFAATPCFRLTEKGTPSSPSASSHCHHAQLLPPCGEGDVRWVSPRLTPA